MLMMCLILILVSLYYLYSTNILMSMTIILYFTHLSLLIVMSFSSMFSLLSIAYLFNSIIFTIHSLHINSSHTTMHLMLAGLLMVITMTNLLLVHLLIMSLSIHSNFLTKIMLSLHYYFLLYMLLLYNLMINFHLILVPLTSNSINLNLDMIYY